nr:MAG TPA: hypothetical protein [Caudoviricetes sp.]
MHQFLHHPKIMVQNSTVLIIKSSFYYCIRLILYQIRLF